jgi:hypothetical protein
MDDSFEDPMLREMQSDLAAPFAPSEIDWRIKQVFEKDGKADALVLAYMDARAVQDRLDDVCGVAGWQCRHEDGGDGRLTCSIGILLNGEWIWKSDGAGARQASAGLSEQDANKGDYSDALKRAAVAWGIGRYLYNLGNTYAPVKKRGNSWTIDYDNATPKLNAALQSVQDSDTIGMATRGERTMSAALCQTVRYFCKTPADVEEYIELNRGTLEKMTKAQKSEIWKVMTHIKEKGVA